MAVKEYGTNQIKEAPSFEGAFLFQRHPHREGIGAGYL